MRDNYSLTAEVDLIVEGGVPLLHSLSTDAVIAFSSVQAVVELTEALTELLVASGAAVEEANA